LRGKLRPAVPFEVWQWRDVLKLFRKAQDAVAKIQTDDYYVKTYQRGELLFYPEILRWIYADGWARNARMKPGDEVIKFLDIGAKFLTMAAFARQTLNADVYALDFMFPDSSKLLAEKMNIHLEEMNIELGEIPFGKKFDIIVFTEILEHLNFNPVPTLMKIKNKLAKDGVLYLSTPNAKWWGRIGLQGEQYYDKWSDIPDVNPDTPIRDDHIWQYNVAELLHVVNAAGLVVVDFDYGWNLDNLQSRRHFNLKLQRREDVVI
jgi:2-polyprenyl-3-methyl-5-hydroxy-6-metoxy-1,4-benzoquinol methylase